MTDTADSPSATGRSPAWRATFLDHFTTIRNSSQANTNLDIAYIDQQTAGLHEPGPNLQATPDPRVNASRETSPVLVVQSRESSPVFRISQSRDTTPSINTSASRESTPAVHSRESTPVLSLDMDDPIQAATAMAWLEGAVRNVDSAINPDRFRDLVAIPLAEEPAMEREALYSQVGAIDETLAVALRTVLDGVEWGEDTDR